MGGGCGVVGMVCGCEVTVRLGGGGCGGCSVMVRCEVTDAVCEVFLLLLIECR